MNVPGQRSDPTWTSRTISNISRVSLRVRDVDRSLSFYRDVVGLEVAERSNDHAALAAPGGSALLVLHSNGVTAPPQRHATGLYHTAISYPERTALANALARLVEAGYRIGAADHWVSEALYVDDPDGNGVELYRDRPRDEWPPPEPGDLVGMGTDPLDLNALLSEAVASGNGEASAPRGTVVGHVHFQVADLDDTVAFYRGVLGLDVTSIWRRQAAFFSSHGYHHHIGANVWHSRGGRPAARNHAGLDHVVFGVELEELDNLRRRLEAQSSGYEADDGEIGVEDPSGIELRFASTQRAA